MAEIKAGDIVRCRFYFDTVEIWLKGRVTKVHIKAPHHKQTFYNVALDDQDLFGSSVTVADDNIALDSEY